MSDLQLGLLVIGVAVVVAVLAYNKWQEIQFRRQAESDFRSRHSDVLLSDRAGRNCSPQQPAADSLRVEARIEPTLEETAVLEAGPAVSEVPPQSAAGEDSAGLSALIDYIVEIRFSSELDGQDLIDTAVKYLSDSSKAVYLIGRDHASGTWNVLQHDKRYSRAKAGLQLVDRRGPVAIQQLQEFSEAIAQFAREVGGEAHAADFQSAADQAVRIDKFCADVDIQVAVHIAGGRFSATKIRALAEAAEFELDDDGRFRRRDAGGRILFILANDEAAPFSSDAMKTITTSSLSLEIDVPRTPGGSHTFAQFRELAEQFAAALGGNIIDDRRTLLTAGSLDLIGKQLEAVHKTMDGYGIRAGSAVALRLFS